MINNIAIKTKLLILLLVPLLLFAVTVMYLLQTNFSNMSKLTRALYDTTYQSTNLVLNADRDMYQAYTSYQRLRSKLLSEQDEKLTFQDFNDNIAQVKERLQRAHAILKEHHLTALTHEATGKSVEEIITEITSLFTLWEEHASNQALQPITSPTVESQIHSEFEIARLSIDQFGEILNIYALDEVSQINKSKKQADIITFCTLVLIWFLICIFGFVLLRKITSTIAIVQIKTKQVSEGILKYQPQTRYDKDELGQILFSVDHMIIKMRELIGNIASSTQSVATASNELSVSAQESTSTATHVAANIQEVTSLVEVQSTITGESTTAMEEMTVGVQKIAESTNQIADHAGDTIGQADQGTVLLRSLQEQMQELKETIKKMNRSVHLLNEKSTQIGAIADNITDFANKTNILSLNAAIEAARAGEQGRGFAVVASEIRKLAASSLESAQVITDLIADTRTEINHASTFMSTTLVQSEQGTSIMNQVADGFDAIVQSIKHVAEQIHDTSAVTQQMSASSEEVSAGMEQSASSAHEIADKAQNVAAATEEQLALVENISHSVEQLKKIVNHLNESVHFFKL